MSKNVPVRIIECSGSHREMGRAQGEQCRPAIDRLDRSLLEITGLAGQGILGKLAAGVGPALAGAVGRIGNRLLARDLKNHYPDQYERTAGIAEGAGVPLNRLFVGPAVELLLNKAFYTRPKGACTAVAVDRNRSENGEPILGKNFDYPQAALDQYIVRISRPDGLAASIDVTAAPMCGSHEGINEYGLAIAYNYGHFKGTAAARVAISALIQELLEQCDSVDEAIEHVERRPRAGSAILMVADSGGNVASIEVAPDQIGVRRGGDENGFLAHSNHALTETVAPLDVPLDAVFPRWFGKRAGQRYQESSVRRADRAHELLAGAEQVSESDIQQLLSDHDGGNGDDNSICRHGEYYATTCSVLMFPRRRSIDLMFGSPCTEKYVTITLEGDIDAEQEGNEMKKFVGTIGKNDLEGGFWELVADDGERYQLRGGDDKLRIAGQKVVVNGTVDGGGFGIGMTGPYLDVSSWSAA